MLAHGGREKVYDNVAIVEHGPAAVVLADAVQMQRTNILFELELFQQVVLDGSRLPFVIDRGNDEVIGQRGKFADIEQDNVRSLLVLDEINDASSERNAVQKGLLWNTDTLTND